MIQTFDYSFAEISNSVTPITIIQYTTSTGYKDTKWQLAKNSSDTNLLRQK